MDDDCDECLPEYLRHPSRTAALLSSLPFILTFALVSTAVLRKLYPVLSGAVNAKSDGPHDAGLPVHNFDSKPASSRRNCDSKLVGNLSVKRVAQLVFATTIALSTVLVELILCEVSNTLNPTARRLALNVTLPTLLFLLIIAAPALQLRSAITSTGLSFHGTGKGRIRVAWVFEILGLAAWLLAFWYMGHGLLTVYLREDYQSKQLHSFSEGCLERVGIIGISLMASLAGFAAISALWQTFGVKDKPIMEAVIARKQIGLESVEEMLSAKRSRLRALERKQSISGTQTGIMSKVIGTIRGNGESQERMTLGLEISGLETMRMSLNNSLYSLRSRRAAQISAHTFFGRLVTTFNYGFAVYCAFRLGNTTLNILRRSIFSSSSLSHSTDPVTHLLALIARLWDPTLNQALWSRQISFLLSGAMLLLSFNSALQTFLLLSRAFPSLLSAAFGGANFALIVSQVCASYVISSALLLRSNLPREVRGVISDALGAPLETGKVDAWFEAWFLGAALLTGLGIWVGRKLGSGEWDDDATTEAEEMEMDKRN
ncbi:ABA-GPCR multi-domain protein [Venturia nashicola]|nr:ABA-GPCR multi-domain protein [Venturia nashicola]